MVREHRTFTTRDPPGRVPRNSGWGDVRQAARTLAVSTAQRWIRHVTGQLRSCPLPAKRVVLRSEVLAGRRDRA